MPARQNPSQWHGAGLVKTRIAGELRQKILNSELQPGEIISETQWSPHFGAAQASVREAINLLEREGLVQKKPGCSARVTKLSPADVIEAYQVRMALEGLAASLIARNKKDPGELESYIETMGESARQGDLRAAIAADQAFHLGLAELSANLVLARHLCQILVPLFAFTVIRTLARPDAATAWAGSVEQHRLILTGIRSGDPVLAEQTVRHVMNKFIGTAQEVWAVDAPAVGAREKVGAGHENH